MTRLEMVIVAMSLVSIGAGIASVLASDGEDRTIYGAYAAMCAIGAGLFAGIRWWVQ